MGLAAVVMAGAGAVLSDTRLGHDCGFGVALVFLVIGLGFAGIEFAASECDYQTWSTAIVARLLIGMSFGALIVALKALTKVSVGND